MSKSNLKERLAGGATVVGGWLQAASIEVAEAMATCGFDWIAVDMEHGSAGIESLPGIFLACECHQVAPLVRLPSADPYLARRCLDTGAAGLIVPVVENAHNFQAFARHLLFPPEGRRGAGLSRCNGWGDTFDAYGREFRPLLVPQIETQAGIRAAGNIAALDYVDALFIGPYDLSADLGHVGDFATSAFAAALASFMEACKNGGKPAGYHQVEPDPAALNEKIAEGFRFVAFGTDLVALRSVLKAGLAKVRE